MILKGIDIICVGVAELIDFERKVLSGEHVPGRRRG